jgi:hypothetical protein
MPLNLRPDVCQPSAAREPQVYHFLPFRLAHAV